MVATITIPIPDNIYTRLQLNAQATGQSIEQILAHTIQIGSPPTCQDIPIDLQPDLAQLDGLTDSHLHQIATAQQPQIDWDRYDTLLDLNTTNQLTPTDRTELHHLRQTCDRFTLQKAQAALLLQWRGHQEISPGA
jgi:hypothetical protein